MTGIKKAGMWMVLVVGIVLMSQAALAQCILSGKIFAPDLTGAPNPTITVKDSVGNVIQTTTGTSTGNYILSLACNQQNLIVEARLEGAYGEGSIAFGYKVGISLGSYPDAATINIALGCYNCDLDSDGYIGTTGTAVSAWEGAIFDDCHDITAAIHPGATEICDDTFDNDCDGDVDYADPDCAAPPTCSDNIQNQDETGVDCGGVCPACAYAVCDISGIVRKPDFTLAPEVTVTLQDIAGNILLTTNTGTDGLYHFSGISYCGRDDLVVVARRDDWFGTGSTIYAKITGVATADGLNTAVNIMLRDCYNCDYDSDSYVGTWGTIASTWPGAIFIDCNDQNAAISPIASEICDDTFDNDCDGLADCLDSDCVGLSELAKVGPDVQVATSGVVPSLTWNGDEYGLAWTGNQKVIFTRLDPSGAKLMDDVTLISTKSFYPSLVWADGNYALAWQDYSTTGYSDIVFMRIDPAGTMIGSKLKLASGSSFPQYVNPQLVWTGSEYGIAWRTDMSSDHTGTVYFDRVASDGTLITSGWTRKIPNSGTCTQSYYPYVAWNPVDNRYGLVWPCTLSGTHANYEMYFADIDPATDTATTSRITIYATGNSLWPSITWSGSEYGLAFQHYTTTTDSDIFFTPLNTDGSMKLASPVKAEDTTGLSEWSSIAGADNNYLVAWGEGNSQVRLAIMDSSGNKIDGMMFAEGARPDVVWNPAEKEYAIAWYKNNNIYFNRVSCQSTCVPSAEDCSDSLDNDCDNLFDCDDPDCAGNAACPTCSDNTQNGDETGIDCGGSVCPACPTCSDNTQNGDETGIDCGGAVCPACAPVPSCTDGIQNQDETGVDCGGVCPACAPLPNSCSELGGETCDFAEVCKGGSMVAADDTGLCCIGGTCARGIFDISDADFTICHGEECAPPAPSCIVPHDELVITENTVLCQGTYNLVDADEDGLIKFGANNIYLDCNDAHIVSSSECSLQGDVNRNGIVDVQDGFYILQTFRSYEAAVSKRNICTGLCDNECSEDLIDTFCSDPAHHIEGTYEGCVDDYNIYCDECYSTCPDEPHIYFDICMDTNQDGSYNAGDYDYIFQNTDCSLKGDLDRGGFLDGMDYYVTKYLADNGIYSGCADMDSDNDVDSDDADAILAQIDSELVRFCNGVQCPAADPWCNCEQEDSASCERNGEPVALADYDFDGVYSGKDLLLTVTMIGGDIDPIQCLDTIDAIVGPGEISYLESEILAQGCNPPGDSSMNGFIDGLDLFLVKKAVDNPANLAKSCTDVNMDGTTDEEDLLLLSEKLQGKKGVGVLMDNKNSVTAKNCNLEGYKTGISTLSTSNSIISSNTLNSTEYDFYLSTGSSNNKIYLNHMYGKGAVDSGPNNQHCVNSKGNFYEMEIGYDRILYGDCGQSIITSPSRGQIFGPSISSVNIQWSSQSSRYAAPVQYKVSYAKQGSDVWTDIGTTSSSSISWNIEELNGYYDIRVMPFDGFAYGTVNETSIFINKYGTVMGYVKCGEDPVPGASVMAEGAPESEVFTGNDGYYMVTKAPVGRYNLRASIEGSTTEVQEYLLSSDVTETTLDPFTKVCPVTLDCEPDCTIKGGDICIPECNGVLGCSINPLCANVKSGLTIEYNETDRMLCCGGEFMHISEEETKVELSDEVEAEDITRTTRIVYYEGKPVKMIITVWE